jgi:hypothetical protein
MNLRSSHTGHRELAAALQAALLQLYHARTIGFADHTGIHFCMFLMLAGVSMCVTSK